MSITIKDLENAKALLNNTDAIKKRIYLSPTNYNRYLKSLGLEPPYMNETDINGTIICLSLFVPEDNYIETI